MFDSGAFWRRQDEIKPTSYGLKHPFEIRPSPTRYTTQFTNWILMLILFARGERIHFYFAIQTFHQDETLKRDEWMRGGGRGGRGAGSFIFLQSFPSEYFAYRNENLVINPRAMNYLFFQKTNEKISIEKKKN